MISEKKTILEEKIQLKTPSEVYSNRGKEDNIQVKYYLNAQIKETNQTFLRDDNIVFKKLDIIKPVDIFNDNYLNYSTLISAIRYSNKMSSKLANQFYLNFKLPIHFRVRSMLDEFTSTD